MNVLTWNMQGASHSTENKWNEGILQFIRKGAEICCLQECGGVPESATPIVVPLGTPAGVELYTWTGSARPQKYVLFYPADPGGNRCNLAIVSLAMPANIQLLYPAAAPIWRPVLGAQYGGGAYCFTMHAISPRGPDVVGLINAVVNGAVAPWSIAGDYNREPNTIPNGTPGVVCPPNYPTHPSSKPVSKYDYATKSWGAAVIGTVYEAPILSDHLAVMFVL